MMHSYGYKISLLVAQLLSQQSLDLNAMIHKVHLTPPSDSLHVRSTHRSRAKYISLTYLPLLLTLFAHELSSFTVIELFCMNYNDYTTGIDTKLQVIAFV